MPKNIEFLFYIIAFQSKIVYPELLKPFLPSDSNTDVSSTSENRVLFERTEVKVNIIF